MEKSKCKGSDGARKIAKYLDNAGIPYLCEVRIPGCEDRRALPFDFVIFVGNPAKAAVVEFDGRQHFEYVAHFHRGGASSLEKQQSHDRLKDEFTRAKGFSILRIAYEQETEIDAWLSRYIRDLKKKKTRIEMYSSPVLYGGRGRAAQSCTIM